MKYLISIIIMLQAFNPASAEMTDRDPIELSIRVIPSDKFFFSCKAVNPTEAQAIVWGALELFTDYNSFRMVILSNKNRLGGILGLSISYPGGTPSLRFPGKTSYHFIFGRHYLSQYASSFVGNYIDVQWVYGNYTPNIFVAFSDSHGNIAQPVTLRYARVRAPSVKPVLAFIFHAEKPLELGFLIFNESNEDYAAVKPLNEKSRIIATAPAINYTRELFLPDTEIIETVIEPDKVGEWRLPWQAVLDLIPAADLKKIKTAGGDLDLVWKVGDLESPVLPMSLLIPEKEGESFQPLPTKKAE